jgi:serine/threonine-protein kinase haspin
MTAGEESVAVKIMPVLRPGAEGNGLSKSPEPIHLSNLLHEIQSLQALETLRAERKYAVPSGHTGFNRLVQCVIVTGAYPSTLQNGWDEWKLDNHVTFNDRPDHYKDDNLHVILVMEFGGLDLEHFPLNSVAQVKSVLSQILSAMALAEEKLEFEHRDLHLGNVLVKETHRGDIQLGNYQTIPTEGIICSIIDCSLARFKSSSGEVLYRDLERDEWLFTGDEHESRQYQIYRDMRAISSGDWQAFKPTNLCWIGYIITELLDNSQKWTKKDRPAYEAMQSFAEKLVTLTSSKEALHALLNLKL